MVKDGNYTLGNNLMTTLPDNDSSFWDKVARKYALRPIKDMVSYEATLARTKSYLKPNHTALEVGAGTGSTALLLAQHLAHITVSDVSPEMIQIGKEKAAVENIDNVSFVVSEAFMPTNSDQQSSDRSSNAEYDVVMAFNLLHLLNDVPSAVRNAAKLTQKGGYFISKSVCVGEMNFLIKFAIKVMQKFGKAPYVSNVTKAELLAAFNNSGFEIVEADTYPSNSINQYIVARKF